MTQNVKQTAMYIEDAPLLEYQNDAVTPLLSIVTKFKEGRLIPPLHQRGKVWSQDKIDNWAYRIKDQKLKPIGAIATYQLDNGKASHTYVNDGLQRITASLQYLNNPERYGDSPEKAVKVLESVALPTQHRHYSDHDEALRDFQYINMGTSLTSYEYCHGILTYMNEYSLWEDLIRDIHRELETILSYVQNKQSLSRDRKHNLLRDNYALFYRFATKDQNLTAYKVANATVDYHSVEKRTVIEWQLRELLENNNDHTEMRKEVKLFLGTMEREIVLIKTIWHELLKNPVIQTPIMTVCRWLLHCSIWKRNNHISSEVWEDFVYKVLHHTKGKSQFAKVDDDGEVSYRRNAGLGTVSQLRDIAGIVGSDIMTHYDNKRRKSRNPLNEKGVDQGHLLPYATHGEGETIPEPASRNRARGKKPIL